MKRSMTLTLLTLGLSLGCHAEDAAKTKQTKRIGEDRRNGSSSEPAEICQEPVTERPSYLPWYYHRETGNLIAGRHQFHEDRAFTAKVIVREFHQPVRQPAGRFDDALLFNIAHFDPPDGMPAREQQPRRLLADSIRDRGLQLYVNYADVQIHPDEPSRYPKPTFFVSLDGPFDNYQTVPPVPMLGLGAQFVSATGGVFGCHDQNVGAYGAADCSALYVTAGLGYGLPDLDPDPEHQALAKEAQRDRLMWWDASQKRFRDIAGETCASGNRRVPESALLGNSTDVVFNDLNGDGFSDLYVTKSGDDYRGARNVLLLNDGTGCFIDASADWIENEPARASSAVAAADLDGDGDFDLAIANRCRRTTCGPEALNYVLINEGGRFVAHDVSAQTFDSRAVDTGDLDVNGQVEIVFGNAGDEYSTELVPTTFHPTGFYTVVPPTETTSLQFVDRLLDFANPNLELGISPQTVELHVIDAVNMAVSPPVYGQDGRPDLVYTVHRDVIKGHSGVIVLGNVTTSSSATGFGVFRLYFSRWGSAFGAGDFTADDSIDLFFGTGHRFSGVTSSLVLNINGGPQLPTHHFTYDAFPGLEHGYGFDFADLNGDRLYDFFQTSRSYDYVSLSRGELTQGMDHVNVAQNDLGTGLTSNFRGRLRPKGMEDGVFADFNNDGHIDAIAASQRGPSSSWPTGRHASATPDTLVLENDGFGYFGMDVEGSPFDEQLLQDARIDLGIRHVHPGIADRAVAGDLDNDGDVDAIVHLFPVRAPAWTPGDPGSERVVAPRFPLPPAEYSFGWRYLENIVSEGGEHWFTDVATTKMTEFESGGYAPEWNRGLGMDVLADFDNNGALDFYTTVGFAQMADEVETTTMTHDLIFMNRVLGSGTGELTELHRSLLPLPCTDVVRDNFDFVSCGSFGIAHGDIDNDGFAEILVNHYAQGARTNYPWLLKNNLGRGRAFGDEWAPRVGPLDDIIDSPDTDLLGNPIPDMDHGMFPAFVDFDADGDLDLVYQVVNDLPRFLENQGRDENGDGWIDATDGSRLGFYEDVTPELMKAFKQAPDAQDMQVIDFDRDGDFDVAVEPWSGMIVVLRNDRPLDPSRPAITDAWPRTGSVRGTRVTLEGVNLRSVDQIELRFSEGTCLAKSLIGDETGQGERISFVVGDDCPVGLAQVRVHRTEPCDDGLYSTQYFGYFVLGEGPDRIGVDAPDGN